MIKFVDDFLNRITMYRLVLYYVGGLLGIAFVLGFFGIGTTEPTALAFSTIFILAISYVTNRLFATLFRVPVNTESIWITAIILALIMPVTTAQDMEGMKGLALASVVAIASKFLLAIGRKHVFNPVAIGVVASAFILDQPPTWWIAGNMEMLPFVLIGGLLVVRKVQRFEMVFAFVAMNLAVTFLTTEADTYFEALDQTLRYSPLLFAAFAMLTEPLTAPQTRGWRLAFGALVGALSSPAVGYGEFYLTPELAFLIGNVFAYVVSPKHRFKLTLVKVEKMASGCFDYVFKSDRKLPFAAGQYVDWTLDVRNADDRGNRRPFTLASAPSDEHVRLGVKFYPQPSAFKQSLLNMKQGDTIYASHTSGSFTLPKNAHEKMVFIAGGIGVTPFRSMIQELINRKEARSLVMFYGNNNANEIAYGDVFDRAERELGIRTVYAVNKDAPHGTNFHKGFIDANLIAKEVPDFNERTFYISGPRAMVLKFQETLKELGIAHGKIKVDYFPGFA